jgi:hypothetical protein
MPKQDYLLAAATIVVQVPQRQGLGKSLTHKEPAQPVRDPASNAANRLPDREPKDFDREGFARHAAQAAHTGSPEIGDPDIDLALRHSERSRGFGAGPPIHENVLHDQRSPCDGHRAVLGVLGVSAVHGSLTRAGLNNSRVISRQRQ